MPKRIDHHTNEKASIFDECNKGAWNAPEGATGKEAEIIVDMQCGMKLQQIQVVNGAGNFKTKEFSCSRMCPLPV